MSPSLLLIICWLYQPGCPCSAPDFRPAFKDGEMARFRVRVGPFKVGEGTALLRQGVPLPAAAGAEPERVEEALWHLKGRGITTGIVSRVYPLDDWLALWMRPISFLPVYRAIGVQERNEEATRSMRYDHWAGIAEFRRDRRRYRRNPKRVKVTCREAPLLAESFEPISLFFYLRSANIEVGDTLVFPVHENGKNLQVEVKADGVESIETLWGRKEAIRARIRVLDREDQKKERPLWVWISADTPRIPLQFVADLKFANLRGDLVGYRSHYGAKVVGELDQAFVQSDSERKIKCPPSPPGP